MKAIGVRQWVTGNGGKAEGEMQRGKAEGGRQRGKAYGENDRGESWWDELKVWGKGNLNSLNMYMHLTTYIYCV